ncbi:MAG: hypothetical protein A3G34_15930 [Candidatus Lindowbacteria bacterium RIFCSPLOWO2_12_FULL_62_27]|nr:MAG: hypothetical protein A3I06_12265 [Candidatus Lindowbacteria bacterium RIFCSPLOWO2_02_FULL_62_12]OGH61650.1 MAG: hypothetical protein A3G34_15930 [Candidatus Lindowbacteria bacterium RIFCSPLOWO2_12_FULL_62_27]
MKWAGVFAAWFLMAALFNHPASAQEEWTEPEVASAPQTGRDEEARRRIAELETKIRKMEAREAKAEEEKESKFKFDLSGKYKIRYNVRDNFNFDHAGMRWKFDNRAFVDYRWQLRIESLWQSWQVVALMDKGNFTFDWKEDGEGTLERWGEFLTVRYALFRDLYVQYTGPFAVQIGRTNLTFGNDIVMEGPTDMVKVSVPMKSAAFGSGNFSLGYAALSGGYNTYSDFRKTGPPAGDRQQVFQADNRLNGAFFSATVRPPSGMSRLELYAVKVLDNGDTGDADLNLDKDFDAGTVRRDGEFEPLWIGIAGKGTTSGVDWEFEGIRLGGSYAGGRNADANAIFVSARAPLKSSALARLVAGLEYARGSGNKVTDPAAGDVKDFNALFTCRDRKKFGNIFTEDVRAGFFLWESNLANLTVYKVFMEASPAKKVVITPSFMLLRTTEDVYRGRGVVGDWSGGQATSTATTNEVGWEFDLNTTFPILERLEGFLNFGYFRPKDVYALPSGAHPRSAHEIVIGTELKY